MISARYAMFFGGPLMLGAAQLGTGLGIAALLLVAVVTTGVPQRGSAITATAWGTAEMIGGIGAVTFGIRFRRVVVAEAGENCFE